MSEAPAAVSLDRLPWLPDEPQARRRGPILPWVIAGTALVGAASYWLGTRTSENEAAPPTALPTQTVPLPQARPAEPGLAPTPQRVEPVEPVVAPPITIVEQPVHRMPLERVHEKPVQPVVAQDLPETKVDVPAVVPDTPKKDSALEVWPVRDIDGASGRLVRIGTFTTVHQAKRGWWAIMKVNPTLKHLPALVVPVRSLRNGRTYFRLQMGTTSQAHSTVLCQRMRMIAQSCVVIGLGGADGEVAM